MSRDYWLLLNPGSGSVASPGEGGGGVLVEDLLDLKKVDLQQETSCTV